MNRVIRLATRTSRLALWQADAVARLLKPLGAEVKLVPIASTGDVDLVKPIYELGVQGVFTKELDIALLTNQADIAVHSLKDVPVILAEGLDLGAVLARGPWQDVLIYKDTLPSTDISYTLATSSIRRKAQWLHRYPNHQTENIRGNVETRIQKFNQSNWNGLLMAKAALDRLEITNIKTEVLDWMLPAPAQGAIGVACRKDNEVLNILHQLNDTQTFLEVQAERQFLHQLKGGCSAPISARATATDNSLHFTGMIHSLDGREFVRVDEHYSDTDRQQAGALAAKRILSTEKGKRLLEEIFKQRPDFAL